MLSIVFVMCLLMIFFLGLPVKDTTVSGILMLIFAFYLSFDMHLVMQGVYKEKISEGDYIYAALKMYFDIVGIFLLCVYICIKRDS